MLSLWLLPHVLQVAPKKIRRDPLLQLELKKHWLLILISLGGGVPLEILEGTWLVVSKVWGFWCSILSTFLWRADDLRPGRWRILRRISMSRCKALRPPLLQEPQVGLGKLKAMEDQQVMSFQLQPLTRAS